MRRAGNVEHLNARVVICMHPGAERFDGSEVAQVQAVAANPVLEVIKVFFLQSVRHIAGASE